MTDAKGVGRSRVNSENNPEGYNDKKHNNFVKLYFDNPMTLFLKTFIQKGIFHTILVAIHFLKLEDTELHNNHCVETSKKQMDELHDPATNEK